MGATVLKKAATGGEESQSLVAPRPRSAGGAGSTRSNRGMSVLATSGLLVADVVGTGVMGLGGDMAALGWSWGLALLVLQVPANYYAGVMLARASRVYQDRHGTRARDYSVLAKGMYAGGAGAAGAAVGAVLYLNLILVMGGYLLVMAKGLQALAYQSRLCIGMAAATSAAPLLAIAQKRQLKELTLYSVVSAACIFLVLVLCLVRLYEQHSTAEDAPAWAGEPSAGTDFLSKCGALSAIVFASGGQKLYPSMMAEMADPMQFPRALRNAMCIYMSLYLLVAVVAYGVCGDHAPGYLLDVLPFSAVRSVAGGLMWVHVLIGYAINSQALSAACVAWLAPSAAAGGVSGAGSPAGCKDAEGQELAAHLAREGGALGITPFHAVYHRVLWFVASGALLLTAFLLACGVPFFADMVSLVGALSSVPLGFLVPGALYLQASKLGKLGLSAAERAGLWTMMIAALFVGITGTLGTLRNIANHWGEHGLPFDCHCDSAQCHAA